MRRIDAPEMEDHAECPAEISLAIRARDRLRDLMAGGYRLESDGSRDRFGRDLVTVRLRGGRDAGAVLIGEGLAQRWPNRGNVWCGRR